MCEWNSRAQEGSVGRMIQEPKPGSLSWLPGKALEQILLSAMPRPLQGTRGAAGGWESSAEGMGTAGGPARLLRASLRLFRGLGVVGNFGEGVVWKVRGLGWNQNQLEGSICAFAQFWLWRAEGIADFSC